MKDQNDERGSKRGLMDGEPAEKRFCHQLVKPSKYPIPFTGTKDSDSTPKGVKRTAPQDNLSAQVYHYKYGIPHLK